MLARSYHDLHECNSSQLVVIIIAFIIRHHLEHIILCLRSIFNRCVPSPTLTVEESQHWRNLSYTCHIQVDLRKTVIPSVYFIQSLNSLESSQPQWFRSTLAPLQDDHFCVCLHYCLCKTTIYVFFPFFSIFAFAGRPSSYFLPLQDEQGVNSSCSHWQFDKTHFSSTIK